MVMTVFFFRSRRSDVMGVIICLGPVREVTLLFVVQIQYASRISAEK